MNLIKDTWQHQVYCFGRDSRKYDEKVNLCQYVRRLLLGIFIICCSIVAGTVLSLVFLQPVVSVLAYLITDISLIGFFFNSIPGIALFLLLLGSILWGIITGFAVVGLTIMGWKEFVTPVLEELPENSKYKKVAAKLSFLNLVMLYIKGKHDKVCFNIDITKD